MTWHHLDASSVRANPGGVAPVPGRQGYTPVLPGQNRCGGSTPPHTAATGPGRTGTKVAVPNEADLARLLGVRFRDPKRLTEALTHRSYLHDHPGTPGEANERLEFLGDAVLTLVVAEMLCARFPLAPEGELTALRALLGLPNALADGQVAFSARAVGNLARPNFPDGVDGNPQGPLSKPAGRWSPFSTGLQLDVVHNAIIQHVAFVAGLAPDVPPIAETLSGFEVLGWHGLLAPAGTPPEVVSRLAAETAKVLEMPDVRKRLTDIGLTPVGDTPAQFADTLKADLATWSEAARASNLKVE